MVVNSIVQKIIILLVVLNIIALIIGASGGLSTQYTIGLSGETGSMHPIIEDNQLLLIDEDYTTENANKGDIIIFDHNCSHDAYYNHKVVDITDEGLITKGINNTHTDQLIHQENSDPCVPEITDEYIVGEVTNIYTTRLGSVVDKIVNSSVSEGMSFT